MIYFKKIVSLSIIASSLALLSPASANEVMVSKLRIDLIGGKQSDFLTIKNNSATEKTAFEIQVKQWKQEANSEASETFASPKNILTDTGDLLAYPKTIVIGPKQEKVIRLITKDLAAAQNNYSYRLLINQLPATEAKEESNVIKFLFNISVPIFVSKEPIKKDINKMKVDYKVTNTAGKHFVSITNSDSQHIQIKGINSPEFSKSGNFYILPGMTQQIGLSPNPKDTLFTMPTDKGDLTIKE